MGLSLKPKEDKPTPAEVKPGEKMDGSPKKEGTPPAVDETSPKSSPPPTKPSDTATVEAGRKEALRGSSLGGDKPRPSKKTEPTAAPDTKLGMEKEAAKPTSPATATPSPELPKTEQERAAIEQKKIADAERERDRPALTLVHYNIKFIADYLKRVAPTGLQPMVFDPTDETFTPEAMTKSINQCIEALVEMSPRISGKVELADFLQRLKRNWPHDKEDAARRFNEQIAQFLGTDASKQPPLDWTPKKKPVVAEPDTPKPPKVTGTVSTEITEAGTRMRYFLTQINRSIAQAGLKPPALKLDSAESILKTLEEINECLANMQVSDNERSRIDGQNFQKTIQEVGSAWSMGVEKGLAATQNRFPRVEK